MVELLFCVFILLCLHNSVSIIMHQNLSSVTNFTSRDNFNAQTTNITTKYNSNIQTNNLRRIKTKYTALPTLHRDDYEFVSQETENNKTGSNIYGFTGINITPRSKTKSKAYNLQQIKSASRFMPRYTSLLSVQQFVDDYEFEFQKKIEKNKYDSTVKGNKVFIDVNGKINEDSKITAAYSGLRGQEWLSKDSLFLRTSETNAIKNRSNKKLTTKIFETSSTINQTLRSIAKPTSSIVTLSSSLPQINSMEMFHIFVTPAQERRPLNSKYVDIPILKVSSDYPNSQISQKEAEFDRLLQAMRNSIHYQPSASTVLHSFLRMKLNKNDSYISINENDSSSSGLLNDDESSKQINLGQPVLEFNSYVNPLQEYSTMNKVDAQNFNNKHHPIDTDQSNKTESINVVIKVSTRPVERKSLHFRNYRKVMSNLKKSKVSVASFYSNYDVNTVSALLRTQFNKKGYTYPNKDIMKFIKSPFNKYTTSISVNEDVPLDMNKDKKSLKYGRVSKSIYQYFFPNRQLQETASKADTTSHSIYSKALEVATKRITADEAMTKQSQRVAHRPLLFEEEEQSFSDISLITDDYKESTALQIGNDGEDNTHRPIFTNQLNQTESINVTIGVSTKPIEKKEALHSDLVELISYLKKSKAESDLTRPGREKFTTSLAGFSFNYDVSTVTDLLKTQFNNEGYRYCNKHISQFINNTFNRYTTSMSINEDVPLDMNKNKKGLKYGRVGENIYQYFFANRQLQETASKADTTSHSIFTNQSNQTTSINVTIGVSTRPIEKKKSHFSDFLKLMSYLKKSKAESDLTRPGQEKFTTSLAGFISNFDISTVTGYSYPNKDISQFINNTFSRYTTSMSANDNVPLDANKNNKGPNYGIVGENIDDYKGSKVLRAGNDGEDNTHRPIFTDQSNQTELINVLIDDSTKKESPFVHFMMNYLKKSEAASDANRPVPENFTMSIASFNTNYNVSTVTDLFRTQLKEIVFKDVTTTRITAHKAMTKKSQQGVHRPLFEEGEQPFSDGSLIVNDYKETRVSPDSEEGGESFSDDSQVADDFRESRAPQASAGEEEEVTVRQYVTKYKTDIKERQDVNEFYADTTFEEKLADLLKKVHNSKRKKKLKPNLFVTTPKATVGNKNGKTIMESDCTKDSNETRHNSKFQTGTLENTTDQLNSSSANAVNQNKNLTNTENKKKNEKENSSKNTSDSMSTSLEILTDYSGDSIFVKSESSDD